MEVTIPRHEFKKHEQVLKSKGLSPRDILMLMMVILENFDLLEIDAVSEISFAELFLKPFPVYQTPPPIPMVKLTIEYMTVDQASNLIGLVQKARSSPVTLDDAFRLIILATPKLLSAIKDDNGSIVTSGGTEWRNNIYAMIKSSLLENAA